LVDGREEPIATSWKIHDNSWSFFFSS